MARRILKKLADTVATTSSPIKGVLLEKLTWQEAEAVLTPDCVVVIPLGAALKEHGPHLRLNNDFLMAEYLKNRIVADTPAVISATVNYHYYPAFIEYPGSASLLEETARDLIVDVCNSLARFGPRRFYVLNTGVSTMKPLALAAQILSLDGFALEYTDLGKILAPVVDKVGQQEGGTHADEIETSMMLYMDPASVDMTKAVKDYDTTGKGRLTRVEGGQGTYSPTGVWGDPTLATAKKGKKLVEALVAGIVKDIEKLRAHPIESRSGG